MFDAKKLLGDFIAGQVGRRMGGGAGGGFGGGGGALGGLARTVGQNPALAGGLASLLLGSKTGRSFGGSAAKLGGVAMIGSLAYRAFQSWQASQGGAGAGGAAAGGGISGGGAPPAGGSFLGGAAASPWGQGKPVGFATPPEGSGFAPTGEEAQQALSRTLLKAMIAAAKADGQIDPAEQEAIFAAVDRAEMGPEDKAFVMDELRAPLDVDAVARSARNPEEAAEIYAASLLAIDVDNPAERGYLALLAARLKLDEGLVRHLHATIEEAGREPA